MISGIIAFTYIVIMSRETRDIDEFPYEQFVWVIYLSGIVMVLGVILYLIPEKKEIQESKSLREEININTDPIQSSENSNIRKLRILDTKPLNEEEKLTQFILNKCGILTNSRAMINALSDLKKISESLLSVLITGESGVGKELVARAVHKLSGRKNSKLIIVDSTHIQPKTSESELFGHVKGAYTGADSDKKGYFEIADGATIFIDEIGDMDIEVQSKILGVLERGEFNRKGSTATISVDTRVIAATNHILSESIDQKLFRKDLYYRLKQVEFKIPPLSERPEDILLLANHFLISSLPSEVILDSDILKPLQNIEWHGNVRELKNEMNRLGLLVDIDNLELSLSDLITKMTGNKNEEMDNLRSSLSEYNYLDYVITYHLNGFKGTTAAKKHGCNRDTITRAINEVYLKIGSTFDFNLDQIVNHFILNNIISNTQIEKFKEKFIKRYHAALSAQDKLKNGKKLGVRYPDDLHTIIEILDPNLFS